MSQKFLEIDTCYFHFPDLTIYAGDLAFYDLPETLYKSEIVFVDFKLGELSKFATYKGLTGRFTFEPLQKHASSSSYRVEVRILDKDSML